VPRTASIPGALQRKAWPYVGVMLLGVVALYVARAVIIMRLSAQNVLARGSVQPHFHWAFLAMQAWIVAWVGVWVRAYHRWLGRMCRAVVCVRCGYEIAPRLVDVRGDEICCHECGLLMDRAEYAVSVRNHGRGLARALFGKGRWLADPPVLGSDAASASEERQAAHHVFEAESCERIERVMTRSERRRIVFVGVVLVLYAAGALWVLLAVEAQLVATLAWAALVMGVVLGLLLVVTVYLPLVWRKRHMCLAAVCARCEEWIAGRLGDVEGEDVACDACGFSVTKAEYAAFVRGFGARLAERIWGKGTLLDEPDVLLPEQRDRTGNAPAPVRVA